MDRNAKEYSMVFEVSGDKLVQKPGASQEWTSVPDRSLWQFDTKDLKQVQAKYTWYMIQFSMWNKFFPK